MKRGNYGGGRGFGKSGGKHGGAEARNPGKHRGGSNTEKQRRDDSGEKLRADKASTAASLDKTSGTIRNQYSSGKSRVVAERSASVMTQSVTPVFGSVYADRIRKPSATERSFCGCRRRLLPPVAGTAKGDQLS